MSDRSDRTIMTLIVTTATLGLIGYVVTMLVYRPPDWIPWYGFPAIVLVLVVLLAAIVWEGLDLVD